MPKIGKQPRRGRPGVMQRADLAANTADSTGSTLDTSAGPALEPLKRLAIANSLKAAAVA